MNMSPRTVYQDNLKETSGQYMDHVEYWEGNQDCISCGAEDGWKEIWKVALQGETFQNLSLPGASAP